MYASARMRPWSSSRLASIWAALTCIPVTRSAIPASDADASDATVGRTNHSACHSPAARSCPGSMIRATAALSDPAMIEQPTMVSEVIGLRFWGIVDDAPR